jgi:hypothetical protein
MSVPAMTPVVNSSNVKAIGYDADASALHVQFHSGGHYVYSGVTPAKHAALMASTSKGSHLHHHITGQHPHRKM